MLKLHYKSLINITDYILFLSYLIITISFVSQNHNINLELFTNKWEIAETINIVFFLIISIIKLLLKSHYKVILILFSIIQTCLFMFKIIVNYTILNIYEILIVMSFARMINLYLFVYLI
jgi:hypothetical protein